MFFFDTCSRWGFLQARLPERLIVRFVGDARPNGQLIVRVNTLVRHISNANKMCGYNCVWRIAGGSNSIDCWPIDWRCGQSATAGAVRCCTRRDVFIIESRFVMQYGVARLIAQLIARVNWYLDLYNRKTVITSYYFLVAFLFTLFLYCALPSIYYYTIAPFCRSWWLAEYLETLNKRQTQHCLTLFSSCRRAVWVG